MKASCPALIVGASDNQVVPTDEQRTWTEADSVPRVNYGETAETGHILPVEAPGQLASAISDWLRSLED
ncbi:alpha/beta hydrolase [Dietzia sp. Alg238-R159]|uniref:alpha/beta fold hydrolase n=1 Tax=Dietzia sp. Alg238-R159 TaxID=2305986 RepID=UPI0013D7AE73|nr:alpha/beta hydrolase [Dietzia sp. Alg238-R159]